MPLYNSLIFFIFLLVPKFLNFSFQAFILFVLDCLLPSYLTLLGLSELLWFGSCTKCILACFPGSKKLKYSSSNHGLCCFNSCRHRLSWAVVFILSLLCSQVLFMSSSSLKFSKAENLFLIPFWYCFLTSSSFSFLRLNLSLSYFCFGCLITASLSLTCQPPNSDQYYSQLLWNSVHLVYSNAISYLLICDQSGCESSHQERPRCTYESFGAGTSCSKQLDFLMW